MKLKFIEHTRMELTHHGYRSVETRTCLECHQFIEIWETPTPGDQIALEVCPDIDWKLLPHVYFCADAKKRGEKRKADRAAESHLAALAASGDGAL